MLEIKEDIREECAKVGEVTNVVLFDKEPDGVASVRYTDAEAAKDCVRVRLSSPHALFGALSQKPRLFCRRSFSTVRYRSTSYPNSHHSQPLSFFPMFS